MLIGYKSVVHIDDIVSRSAKVIYQCSRFICGKRIAHESKLNVVLMNKSQTEAQNANIQITSGADHDTAKVYGITSDSPEIKLLQTVTDIRNNAFTLELPALSVVQIELSDSDHTMQGDVNMDGNVDIADVRLLQDWLLAKPGVTLKN